MWALQSLELQRQGELIHHWSGQSHTCAGLSQPPARNTALSKLFSFSLMLMCCFLFLPYSRPHTASSLCLPVY